MLNIFVTPGDVCEEVAASVSSGYASNDARALRVGQLVMAVAGFAGIFWAALVLWLAGRLF